MGALNWRRTICRLALRGYHRQLSISPVFTTPFDHLTAGKLITDLKNPNAGGIVSNTLRPVVPESCDPEWTSLMERCWSAEPAERPTFTEIANELRSMTAKIPPKGHNPPAASAQPQVQK